MEQADKDREIMENKEMSAKEKELARGANFFWGSYKAAELSAMARRDLVYHPDTEDLQLLSDYMQEQRTEAQNTLIQGYGNNSQWWRDRLAWVDESADKLQLSLDPDNTI